MVFYHTNIRYKLIRLPTRDIQRLLSTSRSLKVNQVQQLPNWDLAPFCKNAYNARIPVKLPVTPSSLPPACHKWFIHDGNPSEDSQLDRLPYTSELRSSFWSEHESTIVPLELTTTMTTSDDPSSPKFLRTPAPLKILLTYLTNPAGHDDHTTSHHPSIYLAQCDLTSLPQPLQHDLPTPNLVTNTDKGDIYSSSLWLGRPPTYTPLHRDPNPNLFLQLAGQKLIRLFPPDLGDAIFDHVQDQLALQAHGIPTSASFRGEEMMTGPETEILHRIVWEDGGGGSGGGDKDHLAELRAYALEARLGMGEALFIPKGWWHSVKGVGDGVTASANWWFR